MSAKNLIITSVVVVVTVFFATIAFNLVNDPGAFFARWASASSRYAAVADSTKLEAWEAGQKWQAIVDRREEERMKKAKILRKKIRDAAETFEY